MEIPQQVVDQHKRGLWVDLSETYVRKHNLPGEIRFHSVKKKALSGKIIMLNYVFLFDAENSRYMNLKKVILSEIKLRLMLIRVFHRSEVARNLFRQHIHVPEEYEHYNAWVNVKK